jgi:hypothetical protein
MLGNEANPTLKSIARVVHALGESVSVSRKPLPAVAPQAKGLLPKTDKLEWSWDKRPPTSVHVEQELLDVIKKESGASNDNYPRVLFMESELPLAPEPEPEAQAA